MRPPPATFDLGDLVELAEPEDKKVDAEEAGDADEARAGFLAPADVDTEDALFAALKVFDRDGNGFISIGELRQVLTDFGVEFTEEEGEVFSAAEGDGKGKINYDDFVKLPGEVKEVVPLCARRVSPRAVEWVPNQPPSSYFQFVRFTRPLLTGTLAEIDTKLKKLWRDREGCH